jgi:lipopolysaccharide transport system permease protein
MEKHKVQNIRIISPKKSLFDLELRSLFQYKDLLISFVKRDISTIYKQTILGPLWFILSPLLTVFIMSIVFGKIVNIPTNGVPKILFYLLGITFWNYLLTNITSISSTFQNYSNIFGKVYFPRLVAPIAQIISNTIKFLIQFFLFICFYIYFQSVGYELKFNFLILAIPIIIILMNMFAMGIGLIVTSLSIKYRDVSHFMGFGLNILFYLTPIIYPLNLVPASLQWIVKLNPISSFFELLKITFFNTGKLSFNDIIYSILVSISLFAIGVILYNKKQREFTDTI